VSYIQVELDAFNAFPLVARATGLTVEVVSHGLLSVWAHCYRAKVDRLRLVELRGFFGPCPDLVEVLEAFNFVEAIEGGIRVRGVDRYMRVNDARREAGRKGGKASAASRETLDRGESGRFSPKQAPKQNPEPPKQTPKQTPKQNDGEVAERASNEAAEAPKQMLPSAPKPPKQTPKQTDSAPKQNQALYPRDISLSSSSPGRESAAHAPALPRVHAPAREAPSFPDAWTQTAAADFMRGLVEHAHIGGPSHAVTEHDLAALATEFGPHFTSAVDAAIRLGQPWQGWRVRNPQNWLRTLCERQRQEAAEAKAKRAPHRVPTYEDLENGAVMPTPTRRHDRPLSYADILGDSP
jgi:hypothetical protein